LASKLERVGSEPEMRQLLCQLPEAMASEVAAAPVGTRPYALGPGERRPMRSGEAAWLRALWSQYGADQSTPFLRAFCSQLLGLQVTLGDKDQPDLRNQIDLVGVSVNDRLPVVIQFETEDAGQSAIAALLGAAARALAIKKAWPHRLRGDWLEALRAAGLGEPRLPVFLERMSIVQEPQEERAVTGTLPRRAGVGTQLPWLLGFVGAARGAAKPAWAPISDSALARVGAGGLKAKPRRMT